MDAHKTDVHIRPMPNSDLSVEPHGSICLIRPHTERGVRWLKETVLENAGFLGPAMTVEPKDVSGVVDAAMEAGLIVEGHWTI
jgi:hypothetical protein